jgi:hypothetical protein
METQESCLIWRLLLPASIWHIGLSQNAYVGAAPVARRAGNSAFVNHQVGGERDLKSPFISYR